MGVKTFGKGSVQTVYPLEGGSGLRLTTALYYTPGGRSIQEVGIDPDIPVDPAQVVAAVEDAPRQLREADLEGHFTHEEADPDAGALHGGTTEPTDVQLARALEVLKSWTYFERLRESSPSGSSLQARADEAR